MLLNGLQLGIRQKKMKASCGGELSTLEAYASITIFYLYLGLGPPPRPVLLATQNIVFLYIMNPNQKILIRKIKYGFSIPVNSFIQIQCTYHKVRLFKVLTSIVFSTFIELLCIFKYIKISSSTAFKPFTVSLGYTTAQALGNKSSPPISFLAIYFSVTYKSLQQFSDLIFF